MNTIKNICLGIIIIGLPLLVSCRKDAVIEETEEQIFLAKVAGQWTAAKATFDGKDVSASFPGLIVSISTEKQVSVTNAVPPIWKGSSMFTLVPAGDSFQLKRDDGVVMTLTQPNSKKLTLQFQYDSAKLDGRVGSVVGEFTFEFSGN